MKKEKTTMIKEDELKQIYGGCIGHCPKFCVNGNRIQL